MKGYFIRQSRDLKAQPVGYALVVKVKVNIDSTTQMIPYILTINGPRLRTEDVQVVAELLRRSDTDFNQSRMMAFPDWTVMANFHLVNWNHSRRAMMIPNGSKMRVEMPEGWDTLVQYHNENNLGHQINYYGSDSIKLPIVGDFVPQVQIDSEIKNTRGQQSSYLKARQIEKIPQLERAILAGQAMQDLTNEGQLTSNQIFQALMVSEDDVRIAEPLLHVSPNQGLTIAQYEDLVRQFGFGLENILAFEVKIRAKVLSTLYEESPRLFVQHRGRENRKIRDTLLSYYGGDLYQNFIKTIWNNKSISDSGLFPFLKASFSGMGSHKIEDYIQLSLILTEFFGLDYVSEILTQVYLASGHNDASLARGLSTIFASTDPLAQSFLNEIVAQVRSRSDYQMKYPILSVYLEVFSRRQTGVPLTDTFKAWIKDRNVSPSKKADFVMTLIGSGETIFNEYFNEIDPSELPEFWRRMTQRTSFEPYYKLAKQRKLTPFLLQVATLETFLYSSEGMPAPDHPVTFEMGERGHTRTVTLTRPIQVAVAPETMILWNLLMGEDPSKSAPIDDSPSIAFHGTVSPNSPVVDITWFAAAEYLNRKSIIEGLEPVFNLSEVWKQKRAEDGTLVGYGIVTVDLSANGYRFATEAEQELIIRAGSTTTYPTGDDPTRLPLVAWISGSSVGMVHPIGQLRPNKFGLVDTIGGVREWGLDRYEVEFSSEAVTNPTGPQNGLFRVIRGGLEGDDVRSLSSAHRSFLDPNLRAPYLGFRSVRAAK